MKPTALKKAPEEKPIDSDRSAKKPVEVQESTVEIIKSNKKPMLEDKGDLSDDLINQALEVRQRFRARMTELYTRS
jgi:hypothetical protein